MAKAEREDEVEWHYRRLCPETLRWVQQRVYAVRWKPRDVRRTSCDWAHVCRRHETAEHEHSPATRCAQTTNNHCVHINQNVIDNLLIFLTEGKKQQTRRKRETGSRRDVRGGSDETGNAMDYCLCATGAPEHTVILVLITCQQMLDFYVISRNSERSTPDICSLSRQSIQCLDC